jgi:hypothetical protein
MPSKEGIRNWSRPRHCSTLDKIARTNEEPKARLAVAAEDVCHLERLGRMRLAPQQLKTGAGGGKSDG